jgi:hypothetical protein
MVHSKKEFADLAGMPTNKLSVFISRKKVILLGDGMIDDTDPRNRVFLEKWRGRSAETVKESVKFEEKLVKKPKKEAESSFKKKEPPLILGEKQSYTESERQLKYLDTLKRQREIDKLDIDIQKKRGEVVPSELIKPVFLQHNQSIITEINNRSSDFIRIFSKKKALSLHETAEIKGKVVNWINEVMDKSIEISISSIETIISEHSETKGVGEHG